MADTIKRRLSFSILGCYVLHRWEGRGQDVVSARRVEKKSKGVVETPRSRIYLALSGVISFPTPELGS